MRPKQNKQCADTDYYFFSAQLLLAQMGIIFSTVLGYFGAGKGAIQIMEIQKGACNV